MSIKRILVLLITIIFLCTPYVLAFEPQISIQGEQEAKVGETKTLSVKISSDTDIGIISGKIEKNDQISNITVQGKNNWNLTYNEETSMFNIQKAAGSKTEEIMTIEYTASTTEGIGKISLTNLELTNIEYESTNIDDITKEITITKDEEQEPLEVKLSKIKIVKAPTKTAYVEGEKFDTKGMQVEAQYSDGTSKKVTNYEYTPSGSLKMTDKKITISYTEGEITKTVEQQIAVTSKKEENKQDQNKPDTPKDDTGKTQNKLPYAGASENLIIATIVSLIISIVCYRAYRNHRGI